MHSLLQTDSQGWVDLQILSSFPRLKELQAPMELIRETLAIYSQFVEVRYNWVRAANDAWKPYILPDAMDSIVPEQAGSTDTYHYSGSYPSAHPSMWYSPAPYPSYPPPGAVPPFFAGHPYPPYAPSAIPYPQPYFYPQDTVLANPADRVEAQEPDPEKGQQNGVTVEEDDEDDEVEFVLAKSSPSTMLRSSAVASGQPHVRSAIP